MMRKCSRVLDKPLFILGLEPEDIAVLLLLTGSCAIVFSPTIPVVSLLFLWPCLVAFKRNKPSGYVLHFLYKWGLPLKGLLPPGSGYRVSPFSKQYDGK